MYAVSPVASLIFRYFPLLSLSEVLLFSITNWAPANLSLVFESTFTNFLPPVVTCGGVGVIDSGVLVFLTVTFPSELVTVYSGS